MRTRNFTARSEEVERGAVFKSQKKGEKPAWRGKQENAISGKQLDNVRKETHVVSVMIEDLETDAITGTKDNRPLLHQKRRHTLTERNHSKVQVAEEKVLLAKKAELRADISLGESARTRHVVIGTLPCVSITSLSQDAHMAKNADSDTKRLMGSPVRSRRKVVSRISCLSGTWHHIKIRERKGPSRGVIQW